MKRTPLKRKTPLKAKSSWWLDEKQLKRVKRLVVEGFGRATKKRSKTKHARRPRAPESWWLFVKSQACFVRRLWILGMWERDPGPCDDVIDADHMGDRMKADGTRAYDSTCAPICHRHHMQRHALTGAFKGFTKQSMRVFTATAVQWTHNAARAAGVTIPDC